MAAPRLSDNLMSPSGPGAGRPSSNVTAPAVAGFGQAGGRARRSEAALAAVSRAAAGGPGTVTR